MKPRAPVNSYSLVALALLLPILATACQGLGTGQRTLVSENTPMNASQRPSDNAFARKFTSSPLRNRLRLELSASSGEVWALIGDLSRFPEYSSGLARVEAVRDSSGALVEYVCHFKAREPGEPGIVERNPILWYQPNRGYASSGEPGNAFGLESDLNLVTIEPSARGTILTWDEYYDGQDLEMLKAEFDTAFADSAEHLIRRFGGTVLQRYVEPSR